MGTIQRIFAGLFKKSQLGLFGGEEAPAATAPPPAPAQAKPKISFDKIKGGDPFKKNAPAPKVGDTKQENGHTYIFLETTIGKPRWHTKEEIKAAIKEGKTIPQGILAAHPDLKEGEKKPAADSFSEFIKQHVIVGRVGGKEEEKKAPKLTGESVMQTLYGKPKSEEEKRERDVLNAVGNRFAEDNRKEREAARAKKEEKPEPKDKLSDAVNKAAIQGEGPQGQTGVQGGRPVQRKLRIERRPRAEGYAAGHAGRLRPYDGRFCAGRRDVRAYQRQARGVEIDAEGHYPGKAGSGQTRLKRP